MTLNYLFDSLEVLVEVDQADNASIYCCRAAQVITIKHFGIMMNNTYLLIIKRFNFYL